MANEHMTPRKFLAKELRRARELKGMSPTDVAKAIYVSEPLVRAWEKGRRLPSPKDLARLEELYGLDGTLSRIREDLVTAAVPVEWFGRWTEIEDQATAMYSFEPSLIPGLLQTEDYARAVLRAGNHIADVDDMLSARLERQHVLAKEDAPMLVFLISENALHTKVGSARIMHEQLLHLADMAGRDNVVIHIIPNSKPACAGFISGFVIAESNGSNPIAYVDNQLNGGEIEDPENVARLRRFFDVFRGDALGREESLDLIRRMAEKWKT